MNIQYFFSSPQGDIPLEPAHRALPFKMTPTQEHPRLTLGDYFDALGQFLLKAGGEDLLHLLEKKLSHAIAFDQIRAIRICSEKHGTLYHIARVEIRVDDRVYPFAVTSAVSPEARAHLARETEVLQSLERSFDFDYVPKVFYRDAIALQTGKGKVDLSFYLGQWFEDYHEWHHRFDDKGMCHRVCIWDQNNGHRFASNHETFEIFRQASRILTLYYVPGTYCQIYPWHHAAGDFIVRAREKGIDIKLITARGYAPVMVFPEDGKSDPFIALIYFFLNLGVKMRLDKADGLGALIWAEDPVLEACIRGFFQAIGLMARQGRYGLGPVGDFLDLLKSFDSEEITRLYQPLLGFYREEEPEGYPIIKRNLENHTHSLWKVIQRFRTGGHPGGC